MLNITQAMKFQDQQDPSASHAQFDELDQVEQEIEDLKILADYRKRED